MFDFFSSLENVGNKNFLFATSTWCHTLSGSVSETSSLPGNGLAAYPRSHFAASTATPFLTPA